MMLCMVRGARNSRRQTYFLMLTITFDILVLLLTYLCSSFIFFSLNNHQIKNMKINETKYRHSAKAKTHMKGKTESKASTSRFKSN